MEGRERPTWEESFMFSAYIAAVRSSCTQLYAGAVIVKDKRIIASGYNGAPPGIENCLIRGCRKNQFKIAFDDKGRGVCRGAHAEVNAMSQVSRERLKQPGVTIYTLYFPCTSCAKQIVGNEIKEVVFSKYYNERDSLTNELFQESGVNVKKIELNLEKYFGFIRKVDGQKR